MNWSQYNEAYSQVKFTNKNKCELSLCNKKKRNNFLIPRFIVYLNEPPKYQLKPPPLPPPTSSQSLDKFNFTLKCSNNNTNTNNNFLLLTTTSTLNSYYNNQSNTNT
jgi:hypothetical protein